MHLRIPKLAGLALTAVSFSVHAGTVAVPVTSSAPVSARVSAGFQGYWREPAGAVLRIGRCQDRMCIEVAALSPGTHPTVDVRNPTATLRGRSLCGLRIGTFMQNDLQHAEGHLYDPRSGRTYNGSMTAEGDLLKLRGYIGVKLLGRTEVWKRVDPLAKPCQP